MKFPTSSSSNFTVSAGSNPVTNSAQVSNPSGGDSTSITITTTSAMSSSASAATDQQGLKKNSEASDSGLGPIASSIGNTQNVASSLTTTAGNFFRKYTSPSSTTNIEMGQLGNKTLVNEADKLANTSGTSEASVLDQTGITIIANNSTPAVGAAVQQSIILPPPQSTSSTKANKMSSSSKPGRAMRSRKVTRAPQPPTDSSANVTPATSKVKKTALSPSKAVQRPCQTHSFHTDAAEVQQMETVLLKLLDDFNSGKLRAFGQGCSMEQMSSIRDQQESLAKLHFEIGARQDPSAPLSEEGLRTANENMEKLMGRLETLSVAIGQLNPASSEKSSPASGGGVSSGTGSGHSNGLKMSSSLDSQNIDR